MPTRPQRLRLLHLLLLLLYALLRIMKEPRDETTNDTAQQKTKEILRRLFNEIDTDHSGFIEYAELKTLMADRGFRRQDVDGAWLSLMAVDDNHDNRVSFPEFERAFRPLVERQVRHVSNSPRRGFLSFWKRKKQPKQETREEEEYVSMENLLNEWQGLAENLNIGNDISMYTPPPQQGDIELWRFALAGMAS